MRDMNETGPFIYLLNVLQNTVDQNNTIACQSEQGQHVFFFIILCFYYIKKFFLNILY